MPTSLIPFSDTTAALAWLPALCGSLIVIIFYVIVMGLLEGAVLHWAKWDILPRAILAAILVNLVSSLLSLVLLFFFQQLLLLWLLIAFALCILVEGGLLTLFQSGKTRQAWIGVLFANQLSFLLLVLPVYYFGQSS